MPSDVDGLKLSKAVHESLDSVVAPSVRERVLSSALLCANVPAIPDEAEAFHAFVTGPLREALRTHLGSDEGEAMFAELAQLARTVLTTTRPPARERSTRPPRRISTPPIRRSSPPRRTISTSAGMRDAEATQRRPALHVSSVPAGAPAPSSKSYPLGAAAALQVRGAGGSKAPAHRAAVMLCSKDSALAQRFRAWLDEHAALMRVEGAVNLLYALEDAGEAHKVIVIDCRTPAIRPHSVATLADELPDGTQVVLWGASTPLVAELVKLSPAVAKWMVCPGDIDERVVAQQCLKLAGG